MGMNLIKNLIDDLEKNKLVVKNYEIEDNETEGESRVVTELYQL